MQQTCKKDPIGELRAANREELSSLRRKDREDFLRHRRLNLSEVEALIDNITMEQFKELVLKIKLKKPNIDVLKAIKNNCCTSVRTEAFFRIDGAFNSLIRILTGKDAHLQLEAAACLTNLACGSHRTSYRIAKAAGAYLVSFINSGSCYLQDQSAWAAGNIAKDCFECFSLLKAQGLIPALITALKYPSSEVIESAVFALHACTKYGDSDLRELTHPQLIEILLMLLEREDVPESIVSNTAFILSDIYYLAAVYNMEDIENSALECILNCFCRKTLDTKITLTVLPLVRCLGFLTVKDEVCQHLSEHTGFCHGAERILNMETHCLQMEILWVLSNISACSSVTSPIVDLNLVLKMIDPAFNSLDFSALKVLYYLSILASKSDQVREFLRGQDIISRIGPLLGHRQQTIQNTAKSFVSLFM